jgi:hypothetical protein
MGETYVTLWGQPAQRSSPAPALVREVIELSGLLPVLDLIDPATA